MNPKIIGVALVAILVIAIGSYFYPSVEVQKIVDQVKEQVGRNFGSESGPVHLVHQEFQAGVTMQNVIATSTTQTSLTLVAGDLVRRSDGAAFDTVIMTPETGDLALTLPASSTLPHFLVRSGYRARQCWHNGTSTAGIDITFAAGTGITLQKATSTGGGIGLPTIGPSSLGCFDFVRATSTAGSFDIIAAFTEYKDAD